MEAAYAFSEQEVPPGSTSPGGDHPPMKWNKTGRRPRAVKEMARRYEIDLLTATILVAPRP